MKHRVEAKDLERAWNDCARTKPGSDVDEGEGHKGDGAAAVTKPPMPQEWSIMKGLANCDSLNYQFKREWMIQPVHLRRLLPCRTSLLLHFQPRIVNASNGNRVAVKTWRKCIHLESIFQTLQCSVLGREVTDTTASKTRQWCWWGP